MFLISFPSPLDDGFWIIRLTCFHYIVLPPSLLFLFPPLFLIHTFNHLQITLSGSGTVLGIRDKENETTYVTI